MPQQYLPTNEIENKFSHYPKEELHSVLRTLMSQGRVSQQYSFGTETWVLNDTGALPNFKSTQPKTHSPSWNTNLKRSKSNPTLQQKKSSQVIMIYLFDRLFPNKQFTILSSTTVHNIFTGFIK